MTVKWANKHVAVIRPTSWKRHKQPVTRHVSASVIGSQCAETGETEGHATGPTLKLKWKTEKTVVDSLLTSADSTVESRSDKAGKLIGRLYRVVVLETAQIGGHATGPDRQQSFPARNGTFGLRLALLLRKVPRNTLGTEKSARPPGNQPTQQPTRPDHDRTPTMVFIQKNKASSAPIGNSPKRTASTGKVYPATEALISMIDGTSAPGGAVLIDITLRGANMADLVNGPSIGKDRASVMYSFSGCDNTFVGALK